MPLRSFIAQLYHNNSSDDKYIANIVGRREAQNAATSVASNAGESLAVFHNLFSELISMTHGIKVCEDDKFASYVIFR